MTLDRWLLAADAVHAVTRLAGAVETFAATVAERGIRAAVNAVPWERAPWPLSEMRDSEPPPPLPPWDGGKDDDINLPRLFTLANRRANEMIADARRAAGMEYDPMLARSREIADLAARVGRIEAWFVARGRHTEWCNAHPSPQPPLDSYDRPKYYDSDYVTATQVYFTALTDSGASINLAADAIVAGAPKGTDQ